MYRLIRSGLLKLLLLYFVTGGETMAYETPYETPTSQAANDPFPRPLRKTTMTINQTFPLFKAPLQKKLKKNSFHFMYPSLSRHHFPDNQHLPFTFSSIILNLQSMQQTSHTVLRISASMSLVGIYFNYLFRPFLTRIFICQKCVLFFHGIPGYLAASAFDSHLDGHLVVGL